MQEPDTIQCYQVFVSGTVQGVFFRESTRQQAISLGVGGWVRNRRDGRVEVMLCGDNDATDSLLKWLKIGPKLAKVTNIECKKIVKDKCRASLSRPFTVLETR